MKIILTGGGSGGHFYPVIAVAGAINKITKEEKLLDAKLYFMSDTPYDSQALFDNNISFIKINAGKLRRYKSIRNFFDFFKTASGVIKALVEMFRIYPDVVFGKGGYASFPAIMAAKLLRIPVIIHESDSVPGRVNVWAGKFAKKIAVSFTEAASFFPSGKVAWTGNPIRLGLERPDRATGRDFFNLAKDVPTILVMGGSLGAELINDNIIDILPELVEKYQVIHQTGKANYKIVKDTSALILDENSIKDRYRPMPYLDDINLKMAAGAATIAVSRSGSGIFELAAWGLPSIIIPITDSNGDHQRKNAFNYAASGAGTVIEEGNLKPHILLSEIERLITDESRHSRMVAAAKAFGRTDAADKIAREIIAIAISHEPA